jgi:protein-disulfide isomerase
MFDYNCSYCRGAVPDMAALMAEDPNLKVILKEFPILTSGSVDAARVAVLVGENKKIDYWDFHQQLFAQRGEVGADQALQVAEKLGGNRVELMLDMNGKAATDALQKSYALAKSLNIGGTPTYIIGDELIPGAVPIDQLREKIANMRACGSTVCPSAG